MNSNVQDKDAIEATIQKYVDGIARHDMDLITSAFHPQAIMSSHNGNDFSVVPAAETIVNYLQNITPIAESSPDFACQIISLDQKETMATAIIAENALEGLNFTTYFHLHKVDDVWLITSKATYGVPI